MATTLAYISLAVIILLCATMAVLSKNLLKAAVALGLSSVALAVLFFLLGARHAGVFELSVGAGLISILFIIAISLTESIGGRRDGS